MKIRSSPSAITSRAMPLPRHPSVGSSGEASDSNASPSKRTSSGRGWRFGNASSSKGISMVKSAPRSSGSSQRSSPSGGSPPEKSASNFARSSAPPKHTAPLSRMPREDATASPVGTSSGTRIGERSEERVTVAKGGPAQNGAPKFIGAGGQA